MNAETEKSTSHMPEETQKSKYFIEEGSELAKEEQLWWKLSHAVAEDLISDEADKLTFKAEGDRAICEYFIIMNYRERGNCDRIVNDFRKNLGEFLNIMDDIYRLDLFFEKLFGREGLSHVETEVAQKWKKEMLKCLKRHKERLKRRKKRKAAKHAKLALEPELKPDK